MKIAIFVVLTCLFVVSAARKRCRSSKDCDEGQCCIMIDLLGLIRGTCKSLAEEDKPCSEEKDTRRGKYMVHCPCKSGMTCEGEEIKGIFVTKKINAKCVSQPEITSKPQTEAPTEETEAPIEETEAPVEETEAPIEETEAPIEETEAPIEETEAPIEETEAPIEETEAPGEE